MAMLQAISAPFTKGVNFTNWLEFRSAQDVEENLYTRKDFENVAALGCDVVRLPILKNCVTDKIIMRSRRKFLPFWTGCFPGQKN